jgi:HK97 family phage portal protein
MTVVRDELGRFRSPSLEERSLRPADDADVPNTNPPGVPPASVGGADYTPGDPAGLVIVDEGVGQALPPLFHASPWDGWPAEWEMPILGPVENMVDVAWMALDLNASVFASMPPYLVNASPNLPNEWLDNPDPDQYTSWATFAHELMWDFQLGEALVIATARYANGWPARFHLAPPWTVNVDLDGTGRRAYTIGGVALDPADVLHIRYRSTVDNARGSGPLDACGARLIAARVLLRYLTQFVQGGAIPSSVLESAEDVTAKQANDLHTQWINARMSKLGLPAVLGGGVTWKPTQANPLSSALTELAAYTEAKIVVGLGVPPFLLGLPSGGDSMTYSNVSSVYDFHWRGGLRPKAQRIMLALSQWLTPRGTSIEVNRDEYVRPGPLERAQTEEIYLRTGVLDVEEVREMERFGVASRTTGTEVSGVFK